MPSEIFRFARALALGAVASLTALAAAPASAAEYTIDGAHSRVGFGVRHMMVSTVKGQFKTFTGAVSIDEADVTKSKITVSIDAASIDTNNEKRDGHLKGADFLDVVKFPAITFASTSVKKQGAKLIAVGDLTLHGVTKPVTLTVEGPSKEWTNPYGQVVRGAAAVGKLSRKDFGVAYGAVTEAGGIVIGDDVALEFDLELTKAAAEAKPAEKK